MKVVNILFNYKKSKNDNHILGVERCFIDYAKYLIEHGNEVLSVSKPGMVYRDHVRKTGSKYFEVSAFGQGDVLTMIRLAIKLFSFKPDVIICHSGRALFFARIARKLSIINRNVPIVAIDHGIRPIKFIKADFVLAVNSFFSKELIKAGKSEKRALVIPNMIEVPQDFKPLEKKPFRKPIRLGSLGRLYPEKYFHKVLDAMAILKDRGIEVNYVIGGVGIMEEELNEQAKRLGIADSFKILGWTEDKYNFFDSVDIFVLPSCGETFGIVLLEAMLYSTPIIASNSWGPNDIIQDSVNGLKISKDEEEKVPTLIADAIEKLVNDQEFAKKLAKNAYNDFFEKYTAKVVSNRLNEILKTAVKEGIDS